MRDLLRQAERVGRSNATVLVRGESGSGKEIIARAIHHYSARHKRSWVDINCTALPENLLESELFGYEKGAFSGADTSKPGLFELADGGTLFLDEIGDSELKLQSRLLRVLDGAEYYRLGGTRKIAVDVRLVTATNRCLKSAVSAGRFRADLYHRLSQIELHVPPLRDREEDIEPLARHILGKEFPGMGITAEALRALRNYNWPGNVRELRNVVIRAAVLATGEAITKADLPTPIDESQFTTDLEQFSKLGQVERAAIAGTLEETHGNQREAAAKLGISRRTLQRRIKSYRLRMTRTVSVGDLEHAVSQR